MEQFRTIEKTYTLADIARAIGRPRTTVKDWADLYREYLPTIGQGKSMRYKMDALKVLSSINQMKKANYPASHIREALDQDHQSTVSEGSPIATTPEVPKRKTDKKLFTFTNANERRSSISSMIESEYMGRNVKVLGLSDLHVPFTDYENVWKIIDDHKDADICLINGDLLDMYSASSFVKDKTIELRRELDEGREVLEEISSRFKHVVVTDGNHERRLAKLVKNVLPPDIQFLFNTNILQMLASGETLDKDEIPNVYAVGSWWIKLWDTIIAHPDNFNGGILKTVENVSHFFTHNQHIPHRVCMIGHTHQAGWYVQGGIKFMETGYLGNPMDYNNGSKFQKMPTTKAYAILQFDKQGQAVFNETNVYCL